MEHDVRDVPPQLRSPVELRYPPEAMAGRTHGDVEVHVTVDATGKVTVAEVVSGDPVFHAEALRAASGLSFRPATHQGVPVHGVTLVRLHFAPPGDEAPTDHILVIGDEDRDDTKSRTTLDEAELERAAGEDLAQTVAVVPGVVISRANADASKPIIRGQTERRLLLLNDGIRHESQKWGPDHAPEIDPFSAGRISVVKGAAGTRYGPDAIGGVLLVDPPPMRRAPGIGGKALLQGATNGRRGYAALRLDAVPSETSPWSFRVEGNAASGATQQSPRYLLGNTASTTYNIGVAAQHARERTELRLTYRRYYLKSGVFFGVVSGTPQEFQLRLEADRPPTADAWSITREVERPYQQVTHDVAALHLLHRLARGGTLSATYAFQNNRRLEFDQVRQSIEGPQLDFLLRTHSVDARVQPAPHGLLGALARSTLGVQGIVQENIFRGRELLPNYLGFGASAFVQERLDYGRVEVDAGARFDHLTRTGFLSELSIERAVREGVVDREDCPQPNFRFRCPGAWTTASASLGAVWRAVPDAVDVKLDLSQANRFPAADELYLIGAAPSFPVYAVGDQRLGVETTWNASGTLGLRLDAIEGEVSGWGSLVQDYIYFAPALNDDGEVRFDVTSQGTFPRYGYSAIPAAFWGTDGRFLLGPTGQVGLELGGSIVRSVDRSTGAFLIGTPPDRGFVQLIARPFFRRLNDVRLAVRLDGVARQSRTDLDADFAPPPDAYALLGASAEAAFRLGRRQVRIGLEGHNLLNTRYRDYTSLLRYYADFPGRDVRFRLGFDL
ncbi:MAG: TonB-dependent receptor [Myxococcota bacterium]